MFQRLAQCFFFVFVLAIICSCTTGKDNLNNNPALFSLVDSNITNIKFSNPVAGNPEMNIFNYHNFFNGGGVAIGDINNDGKPDIFFTGNQQGNKLYLNKGNFKFEDITDKANLNSSHKWHTGVTMVDINGDGWLDIYVCNSGNIKDDNRANELFINQKDGSFKEEAAAYGLDDKGESTQAIFFDFDKDGDLDCFILNNSHRSAESFGYSKGQRLIRDSINGDRLYRNDGGKFKDVSEQAGIYGSEIGFGLGVVVSDVNNDGWDDMYVCNDFFERDYLYINNHDGTFKEVINKAMGHISNGSMGCDMADINNDGWMDIFTAEMLPENDYRLKTTLKFDEYDVQNAKNKLDFHHQFTGNCLQLNNKDGSFSEIAQMAAVDASNWSWSALCFDFDNDGWKDIYVCNGLSKDLTDQDFLEFLSSREIQEQARMGQINIMDVLKKMPSVPQVNYGFVNQKNLLFKNQSSTLGFLTPSFSNGAAYGDLDGDGDLDLVVNNVNQAAFIYRNNATESLHHHYLKLNLHGVGLNVLAYGTRVTVYTKSNQQLLEQQPTRGFESSVDPVLNFGVGLNTNIDSIEIRWPDNNLELIKNIKSDTLLQVYQKNAPVVKNIVEATKPAWYINIASTNIKGNIEHHENDYSDFDFERLIPKLLSTESPKLAVADLNNDGLEDFYLSSAINDTAKIFLQLPDGHFIQKPQKAFEKDKMFENTGAVFFDADGDGDQDLLVVSGGNQFRQGAPELISRLYLNDGKGNFSNAINGWPSISLNASCVRVGDFNNDGKPDVFIGARNVPGSYGVIPASVLLLNNGAGRFTDITTSNAPSLLKLGMVTDAQWVDIDNDGKLELVVVGDWMPVTILKNINGQLQKVKEISNSEGWWNCLSIADLNGDGKPDFIAGNNGINTRIRADKDHPAKLYTDDFDNNGQVESIPTYYKSDGKSYPYYLKGELESQLPMLKSKFLHFSEYAGKTIEEIFSPVQLQHAQVLTVNQTESSVFINLGNGNFEQRALPMMAQISPVYGAIATDLNYDGKLDLFLGGNFYGLKPQTGRFDASFGTTLIGLGNSDFRYLPNTESGLKMEGELRDIKTIKSADGNIYIIAAMNNAALYLFKKNAPNKK